MNVVKIIIANAGQIEPHIDKIIDNIPEYYVTKYRSMKKRQEAYQELAAGFLLKKYLGVSSDTQLIRTEYGKPMLQSGQFFFNISHSGEYVVLAISDMDVGVDIEKITEVHWMTVRKVFSKKQQEQLKHICKQHKPQEFTKLWTEYEAKLKLLGTGFFTNTKQETIQLVDTMFKSIKYKDYMITCAAYERFYVSVEENIWT